VKSEELTCAAFCWGMEDWDAAGEGNIGGRKYEEAHGQVPSVQMSKEIE